MPTVTSTPYLPIQLDVFRNYLFTPLRLSGKNSIVGDDYWDNKKEYTGIEQPTQPQVDVSLGRGEFLLHNLPQLLKNLMPQQLSVAVSMAMR
eukprot:scaffold14323_cov65-Cyclotella_meneghiniana.AAC.9